MVLDERRGVGGNVLATARQLVDTTFNMEHGAENYGRVAV